MVALILVLVLLLVLIGLLYIPIELYLNTNKNLYYINLKGLAKAWLVPDKKEVLKIKLRIFFFNHYYYPLRKRQPTIKKEGNTKKRRIRSKNNLFRILKSFKVKAFWLDIDTGDFLLNAKLYPLFAFANHYGVPCNINFKDNNLLVVHLQNRPIRLIKSFINYKT